MSRKTVANHIDLKRLQINDLVEHEKQLPFNLINALFIYV